MAFPLKEDFPLKGESISSAPEETILLGEKIGSVLKPGDIVALRGKLGAGKTVLARGIAKSLGVQEELTSASYMIICEYKAEAFPLYHMDAYRIKGNDDFLLAGGEEFLYGNGVCIIEWPEHIRLPLTAYNIEITIMEDGKRFIRYGASL